MQQHRKFVLNRPPGKSQSVTPYYRESGSSPFAFTGRRLEVPKGRVHNPNEAGGQWSTVDWKYTRTLTNIENSEYRYQLNYDRVTQPNKMADSRCSGEIKNYMFSDPFYEDSDNYSNKTRDFEAIQSKVPVQLVGNLCLAETDVVQKPCSVSRGKIREVVCEIENKVAEQSGSSKSKTLEEFQSKRRENQSRVLTGPVEKIIQWYHLKNHFHLLFEVIGVLVDLKLGILPTEKYLVLKDDKTGPSLLVVYYEMDRSLPELTVGSIVRCIGRLTSRNSLQAFKVEQSSEQEKADSQRLFFISGLVAEQAKASSVRK